MKLTSCNNVSNPLKAPTSVFAFISTLLAFISKEYVSSLSVDKLDTVSKLIIMDVFLSFIGKPTSIKTPVLFANLLKNLIEAFVALFFKSSPEIEIVNFSSILNEELFSTISCGQGIKLYFFSKFS